MRKNSIKNNRINEEVSHALSNIIRGELKDPRIHPFTSVVRVIVAPDLKTAKAYISVLGDEKAQQDTLEGLNSAMGFIRNRIAKAVNLRNTPEITFIMDQSIEYGVNMSRRIDEVVQQDEAAESDRLDEASIDTAGDNVVEAAIEALDDTAEEEE